MTYGVCWAILFCAFGRLAAQESASPPPQFPEPELLSFDELTVLSTSAKPEGPIAERLNKLLTTPFVKNNDAGAVLQPRRPLVNALGPVVRTAFWNIERGLNFDLIRSTLRGETGTIPKESNGGANQRAIEGQLRTLRDADIVILNEVDWGMKRTGYRDVARDLASAIGMNYAFGVEFVEVDRFFELGLEQVDVPDKSVRDRMQEDLRVDREHYRGLHGNAVLSRYPIRRARIVRLPVCYDWAGSEMKAVSILEQGKRWTAQTIFQERIQREVRQGGRMTLMVDLAVPGLPTNEVTVVSAHLENKCPPRCRQRQIEALLAAIQDVKNPVVLAGDFNTSGSDGTPTSVRNEIMKRVADYQFWISQAVFWFSPVSIPHYAVFPLRYFNGYLDPTALHIPFLWQNSERGLFKRLEKFRFSDGGAFDFRGRPQRTLGHKQRTLADSNQRGRKGFVPTYEFERNFGGLVGRFKLDWFIVKPFIGDPRREGQSYRFAPHFPITMRELNGLVEGDISDHPPLTVDLPLFEPAIAR